MAILERGKECAKAKPEISLAKQRKERTNFGGKRKEGCGAPGFIEGRPNQIEQPI